MNTITVHVDDATALTLRRLERARAEEFRRQGRPHDTKLIRNVTVAHALQVGIETLAAEAAEEVFDLTPTAGEEDRRAVRLAEQLRDLHCRSEARNT